MNISTKTAESWDVARLFITMGEWLEECHARRLTWIGLAMGLTWSFGKICFGPALALPVVVGLISYPVGLALCCTVWGKDRGVFSNPLILCVTLLLLTLLFWALFAESIADPVSLVFSGILMLIVYVGAAISLIQLFLRKFSLLRLLVLQTSLVQVFLLLSWQSPLPVVSKSFLFICFALFYWENSYAAPASVRRFFAGFLPLFVAMAWGLALVAGICGFLTD